MTAEGMFDFHMKHKYMHCNILKIVIIIHVKFISFET